MVEIDGGKGGVGNRIVNRTLVVTSLVVTILLLFLVLEETTYLDFEELILKLEWGWLFFALILTMFYHLIRTARVCVYLMDRSLFFELFPTLCFHAVLMRILPGWLGELGFVGLLRVRHNIQASTATALLLSVRFLDLLMLGVSFLAVMFFSDLVGTLMLDAVVVDVLVCLILAAILLFTLGAVKRRGVSEQKADETKGVRSFLLKVREGFQTNVCEKVFLTFTMWVVMFAVFICYIKALTPLISFETVFFLYILIFPFNLLPIRGVANLGVHEATWFTVLSLLGVEHSLAASVSIASHVLILMITACLFLISVVLLRFEKFKSSEM